MRTLADIRDAGSANRDTTALVNDYRVFERRRTTRRQYMKALGGMAALVLLGAAFKRVPVGEAFSVAGLLIAPPLWLAIAELICWRRLMRRLDEVRLHTRHPSPRVIERSVSNVAAVAGEHSGLFPLTITALGVVYGDIGTSVLYAMRECFFGSHAVPPTHQNVLGVLSLIIWSLLLVVSLKYVALVLRADNHGEGGILALTALVPAKGSAAAPSGSRLAVGRPVLIALGIFGTALLYGDGMITPAISVLGAVEGMEVVTPFFTPYVVPITVSVLIGLFMIQRFGTHRVGGLFGPIVIVWFLSIAGLGILWISRESAVLGAFDPRHAVTFFRVNGYMGFAVLGAVFLVVTGGEALYADMGHFGRRPIRLAWFGLVLPCLILNYLGQGALLLTNPEAHHTFFMMAPSWALVPLVVIATAAACIASQALISGSFSITQQAVQLGLAPRLDIEHTSARERGQVYVPRVNWALMFSTLVIVIGFGSSSALAAAYGIAVTLTMIITALLLYVVMTERWQWPRPAAMAILSVFLLIDVAFFGANALKIIQGGWLPLAVAAVLFTLMTTWRTGRQIVAERLSSRAIPLSEFFALVDASPPVRVAGTAVYMTAQGNGTPAPLIHNLQYNKVLHERVVILNVVTVQQPHCADDDRFTVESLGHGVFNVRLQYGFMEDPHVPRALMAAALSLGMRFDFQDVVYFLGRETLLVTTREGMALWREKLFVLMSRNAGRATAYFRLPPERVVELGVQVEM
jgi:KUP system potassium uptake protein